MQGFDPEMFRDHAQTHRELGLEDQMSYKGRSVPRTQPHTRAWREIRDELRYPGWNPRRLAKPAPGGAVGRWLTERAVNRISPAAARAMGLGL